jgi:hypothetical protein
VSNGRLSERRLPPDQYSRVLPVAESHAIPPVSALCTTILEGLLAKQDSGSSPAIITNPQAQAPPEGREEPVSPLRVDGKAAKRRRAVDGATGARVPPRVVASVDTDYLQTSFTAFFETGGS